MICITWLKLKQLLCIYAFVTLITIGAGHRHYSKKRIIELREQVRGMFQHAYDGYLRYAGDYDELRPLTCDGIDTWGSYSLTLVDALDTLATMGNFSEFRRVALLLEKKINFDQDINVSVFETNIRIVGGLLSAHLMSKRAGLVLETGWPCQGPLLRLAEDVGRRLLPAFDTATGMPYGTVNLRYGVPKGETTETCTAGVGTFLVEFGALSRLTGNPIFEEVALHAVYALWERRSPIGLFGNHIDVQTGRWTALDAGIGAGVDSLFEYLVKASILLNRPELLQLFHDARYAIDKYLKREDWYVWAGMNKGQVTLPVFQSLEAFWPGTLSLIGDTGPAMRTLMRYSSVWHKYGFLPEFYNIPAGEVLPNRGSYPLRPELVESAMYLYRATKNPILLELGEDMLQSIEFSAKTKCGYATIRNVVTHEKENRMESFFLAETTKYLYLLFDEDNFLHSDGSAGERWKTSHGECVINAGAHIFNTEAHPVDMSALYCCHDLHEDLYSGLDLSLFRDDALLKAERARSRADAESNPKYQCDIEDDEDEKLYSPPMHVPHNAKQTNISVDIAVFDEHDHPAAEILIENFEMVKNERQQSASQHKEPLRNQLTVSDLNEFFDVKRTQFKNADEVLAFVSAFMRNFTLDAAFISGLQIFDKNVSVVLGAAVQKEFEGSTRSLWELYELQQQHAVNVALVSQLGLLHFDEDKVDDSHELVDNVLKALNHTTTLSEVTLPAFQVILDKLQMSRLAFEVAMVNTTAMQNFLLRILINGTTEKRRTFEPLLNENEISTLHAPFMKSATEEKLQYARSNLFGGVRRVVEFKKRMIETFKRLQTLMLDSEQKQQPTESTSQHRSDDLIPKTLQQNVNKITSAGGNLVPSTQQQNEAQKRSHRSNDEEESAASATDSVWSQLVQTILRKTTTPPKKFDEQQLLQKTRRALQNYVDLMFYERNELFQCERPKFIDKFAYREFYP